MNYSEFAFFGKRPHGHATAHCHCALEHHFQSSSGQLMGGPKRQHSVHHSLVQAAGRSRRHSPKVESPYMSDAHAAWRLACGTSLTCSLADNAPWTQSTSTSAVTSAPLNARFPSIARLAGSAQPPSSPSKRAPPSQPGVVARRAQRPWSLRPRDPRLRRPHRQQLPLPLRLQRSQSNSSLESV